MIPPAHVLLRRVRRGLGLLLLLLPFLPVHRLLDPERAGPAAAATLDVVDGLQPLLVQGTLALLLAAFALALLLPLRRTAPVLNRVSDVLARVPRPAFALFLAALAGGLGLLAATELHRGLPRLVDEMAQLLHARALAEGRLTVPLTDPAAARLVQNGLATAEGWVAVYPPGHTLLLAAGLRAGAAHAVGPLLLAVTAAFTFLSLDRLTPRSPATARLAGLLVAVSPFLLLLGSGYLSHVAVAAAAALTLYAAVRAWQGHPVWALPAGAAVGLAVCARPWSGLLLGGFLSVGIWVGIWWREGRTVPWLFPRLGWWAIGGLPFALGLGAFNARLFGAPGRLGYEAAFGPDHGLGFHRDPWGNLYGLREAVGYTGADLTALSLHLLETPVPALAVVGAFFLAVPRLSAASRILLGWALLPVLGNAFYWHHGYHLGPRMLAEAAPAWAALVAVGAASLVRGATDPGLPWAGRRAWRGDLPSSVLVWLLLLGGAAGWGLLLPERLTSLRWDPDAYARSLPPEPPDAARALVFVHGGWPGRVAARLAGTGMRRDSVETALRRNGLCAVHRYAEARAAGASALPALDLESRPGTPGDLTFRETAPGLPVRVDPAAAAWPETCAREAQADRAGVVELAPLLWQTPLPGSGAGPLLVRDLGPAENARLLASHPGRTPWVWAPTDGGVPTLLPYDEGMRELWKE